MVHIGRAICPLIGARQRRCRIMFVKTLARDGGMLQIGRQRLKPRRIIIPIVECRLQRRRDMPGVGIPCQII